MTYVLAVDPGKATGLASWRSDDPDARPWVAETSFYETLQFVDRQCEALGSSAVIVCEAFIIGPETLKKSRQTWSLELIGGIRYLAEKHGSTLAPLQKAAEAKLVVTDARLRHLDWYERGKEHGRDATRHLVLWLMKNGKLSPERLGVT